jgi:serine/threonine protein kinase
MEYSEEYKQSDFDFGMKLGSGKYGTVFLARHKKFKQFGWSQIAIKIIFKRIGSDEKKIIKKVAEKEIVSHKALYGIPNVIDFYGWFEDEKRYYLLIEFLECKNLYEVIDRKSLPYDKVKKWAYEILLGLKGIHDRGYVHSDMKPENVMLECDANKKPFRAKIADFGLTKSIGESCSEPIGTLDYLSPEIILEDSKTFDPPRDMWAYGCIVFEMLTGNPPFEENDYGATMYRIVNVDLKFPQNMEPSARSFIQQLLIKDPTERMTAEQALNHAWFKEKEITDAEADRIVEEND